MISQTNTCKKNIKINRWRIKEILNDIQYLIACSCFAHCYFFICFIILYQADLIYEHILLFKIWRQKLTFYKRKLIQQINKSLQRIIELIIDLTTRDLQVFWHTQAITLKAKSRYFITEIINILKSVYIILDSMILNKFNFILYINNYVN